MTRPGFLLAIEGGDGAGKSTVAAHVADLLRADGHDVVLTGEPGTGSIGLLIRAWLADEAHASHRALLGLYLAARAQHVDTLLRPALAAGKVVVCDRYVASTMAYQGAGAQVYPGPVIAHLDELLGSDGVLPDLTILLDLPALASAARVRRRGGQPDHFERQDVAWRTRVREAYRAMAAADPQGWVTVDAREPLGAVQAAAAQAARAAVRARTVHGGAA